MKTKTETLWHNVVLQKPSALIQYIVVMVGLAMYVVPDIKNVPPHDDPYQFQFALDPREPPEKVNVDVDPVQIFAEEAFNVVGGKEIEFTLTFAVTHVVV